MKLLKMAVPCPPDSIWKDYFFAANDVSKPELDRHLESCPRCQKLLRQLTPDIPLKTIGMIRTDPHSTANESGCNRLIESAKKLSEMPASQALIETRLEIALDSLVSDRYQIKSVIGKGGMGTVFRAYDSTLNREVALKTLDPQSNVIPDNNTLLFEARRLARIQHHNVVTVFEADEHHGTVYLTMPILEGGTLADYDASIPPRQIVKLMIGICKGVSAAHRMGIIHRDLKPSNILLTGEGEPVVTDFGLALDDKEVRKLRDIAGTANFMAPEQWGRPELIDITTDVYGIGGILHFLLWHKPPTARTARLKTPRRGIRDLAAICNKCLSDEADERYASVTDLYEEFDRIQEGYPVIARKLGVAPRVGYWGFRNAGVLGLLGFACALVVALGFSVWNRNLAPANQPNLPVRDDAAEAYEQGTRLCKLGFINDGLVKISGAIHLIADSPDDRITDWCQNQRFWEARKYDHLQPVVTVPAQHLASHALAVSDQRHLVVAEDDGSVHQWRYQGDQVWSEKLHELVLEVQRSNSNRYLVTRGVAPHAIKIVDATSKLTLANLRLPSLAPAHAALVDLDRKLVVASKDPNQPLQFFSFDPLAQTLTRKPLANNVALPPIQLLAIQPAGNFFATVSTDNSFHLWDARTETIIRSWAGNHFSEISQVCFDSEGGVAVLTDYGKHITYFCPDRTCQIDVPIGRSERCEEMEWTGSERGFWMLINSSGNRIIRQWNPHVETYRDFDIPPDLAHQKLSQDVLLDTHTTRKAVTAWSTSSQQGTLSRSLGDSVRGHAIATTPDGSFVVVVTRPFWKEGTPIVVESRLRVFFGGALIPVTDPLVFPRIGVSSVAISHDGTQIAIGTESPQATIQIGTRDSTGQMSWKTIHRGRDTVWSLAFDSKGRLAAGSADGAVTIFDPFHHSEKSIPFVGKCITAVRFSTSNDLIAAATRDGQLYLCDTVTGHVRETLSCDERVNTIAFSRDGQMVAASTSTHWAVWRYGNNAESPELIFKSERTKSTVGIHFGNSNGLFVVAETPRGQHRFHCVNAKNWEPIGRVLDEPRRVTACAVTIDGSVAFTLTGDGQICRRQLFVTP